MSDYLPGEVLINILTSLPTKSLLRFTCVYKSWYSLITSPNFITTHLNRTNNQNHLVLLRYYPGFPGLPGRPEKVRYILHFDSGDTFEHFEELDFPFKGECDDYFCIIGSCNGLICLTNDSPITIFMWNPSIRKSLTLPSPNFTYWTHGPHYQIHGFGFDSRNDDYKVVRMFYKEDRLGMDSPYVEVYKLSTGYWEIIIATIDPLYYVPHYEDPVFINGAVHWYGIKRGSHGHGVIVSFDLSDEVFHFHLIDLPLEACGGCWPLYMPLAVVSGECLSFCYQHIDPAYCCIWVMKEYGVVESWTKLHTFDLTGDVTLAIGFRRNGEILLAGRERQLVSYDTKSHQFKLLGVNGYTFQIKPLGICDSDPSFHKLDVNYNTFRVDAYVESLVLLGMQPKTQDTVCDASEEDKEE